MTAPQDLGQLQAEIGYLKAKNEALLDSLKVAVQALEKAAQASSGMTPEDDTLPPDKLAARCMSRYLAAIRPQTAEELREALARLIGKCAEMGHNADAAMAHFHSIARTITGGPTQ